MDKLYDLKETLCKQLEDYSGKELTAGTLDVVDKLSHTIKNLDKIIEKYEEEDYSNNAYEGGMGGNGSYRNGGSYRGGSYARGGSYRGGSYARGRGSNARRDSMGRYASEGGYSRGDMMADLHDLMESAPDDRTRMEFQKFIQKMEQN